jgi:hypothetical protein
MIVEGDNANGGVNLESRSQDFHFWPALLSVVDGETDAAVLLSYGIQRQKRDNSTPGSSHRLYWSMTGLVRTLGLTRTRLDSARDALRESGILIERRRGWPAKLECHLHLQLLEHRLSMLEIGLIEKEGIPVNQEMLHFTGQHIHAALMLSYAVRRQHEANVTLPPDLYGVYWPMQQQAWKRLLGLTRRRQESARKLLRETGCWKERRWGWPAQTEFHLDLERLGLHLPMLDDGDMEHT